MTEADLRDQLLEAEPALGAAARTPCVLVDNRDRFPRPTELDRPLLERILSRRGLDVALHLLQRGLAHIHHRAPPPMRLGHPPALTHHARPPPDAPTDAPA